MIRLTWVLIQQSRNQKEIPTPETEVEKNQIANQAHILRKHFNRESSYFQIRGQSVSQT